MVEKEIVETIDSLVHQYEALMDESGNDAIGKKLVSLFDGEKERLLRMRRHMEETGESR